MDSLDFSDILASSIHDIKNSLSLILTNLEDLINNPDNHIANPRQASLLQHEARRANNNLIQLLTLYKLGQRQLAMRVTVNNLADFLEEVVAENLSVCRTLDLELSCRCDPDLEGYFDLELVRGVLDSTIGNARRYARSQIEISADQEDDFLVIRVEDDGVGFPPALLNLLEYGTGRQGDSLNPGRTQLGLYFASRIAQLHRNGARQGRIQLRNGHHLPGGCFELWLP
ncbi:sensor histidine kinase [Thermochromatium tepidum]|uniref:Sensor histidine kinase n=1 Tax=Thermochromatium tepidum ATCC 43061 TaxID=316276 RepID=A0A6I6ECL0_THETI|nr:HAMP domain-containing sensor histidine kinase [Thermochromatium tepidum]QGU31900.1 sensor histidine kinase [Thermochromatium tepidum ATCC 43061]